MAISATQALHNKHTPYAAQNVAAIAPTTLEGMSGFKDALNSDAIVTQQTYALNKNSAMSEEQALKVASDMMEAFYTQSFKAIFEETKNEEDETFSMGMTKDIFVEQLAKVLSKNITPTHRRIASIVTTQAENHALMTSQDSEAPLEEVFEKIAKEGGVDVVA